MDRSKISGKISAQVIIEFVSAFIILLVFLVAATKIFVWFCGTVVERHEGFEKSRTLKEEGAIVVQESFYDDSGNPLNIFNESE